MAGSALTFPYLSKYIDLGRLVNPFISIPVKAKWGWQNLWFLVDSGADVTMLTIHLAERLGFPYDKKIKTKLYGIGEKNVDAYLGRIIIKLGAKEINIRTYFIDVQDSTLLLGRLDVFDRFLICFDPKLLLIEFNPL